MKVPPGLSVPIPRVPTPLTTRELVSTPTWNFCAGMIVPIPIELVSSTIKELSPLPTWNLALGWVVAIPTRPPTCPSKSDDVEIATKTVPPAPTLCLW